MHVLALKGPAIIKIQLVEVFYAMPWQVIYFLQVKHAAKEISIDL